MSLYWNEPTLKEALEKANQGISGIETMDLGPLDYNVATTADYLRTAAALVEAFGQKKLDQRRSEETRS